jgi:osmoprotectant transport system ATP-binding protein
MTKFDKKYLFPYNLKTDDLLKKMIENNIELAIIEKYEKYIGLISIKDLIKNKKTVKIENIISHPPFFNQNDNISSAITEMKNKKQSTAIVLEQKKPIGMLFADKILLKLV